MFSVTLSSLLALAAVASAQSSTPPQFCTPALYDMHFDSPADLPEQVITSSEATIRGPQTGYSICNSTTENQQSECQVLSVNSPSDFCLWGPPTANSTISDDEGIVVAWCSAQGHGTRLMPEGTITGLSWFRTPDYVMIVGNIIQENVNMQTGDSGGELDPHGADLCGNAIGATTFSTVFNSTGNTEHQVSDWTQFIGNDAFCLKICDPNSPLRANYCENRYDLIGLNYNCPAPAVEPGVFVSCEADNMTPVGTYVTNGVTSTWSQPPESLGPVTFVPYTPVVPATSNCVTLTSSALFQNLPQPTAAVSGGTLSSSGSASATASAGSSHATTSATRTGSSSGAAASATGGSSQSSGAGSVKVSALATLLGAAFAVAFLS